MSSRSKSSDFSVLKIDLTDLVKQICLKDIELFHAITVEEINSFRWTKARTKDQCPNLLKSTKQFNKISMWVQREILYHDTTKEVNKTQQNTAKDVKILSKFIKLSKGLLDYNNFQSAYAVKAALDSTPIHRLEQLWSSIDKSHRLIWERLCMVFSVEDNYQRLRASMTEKKLPLIPFLGVFLGDLTGLDAAHPKVDGHDTEIRKTTMQKIYDSILYYQNSKYDFKYHDGIQKYLESMEYMEEFENIMLENYFYISKEKEPDVISKASDSSHTSSTVPQILVGQAPDQYSNIYKKKNSPDISQRASYRVRSEHDRKVSPLIVPDSPTLTDGRQTKSLFNDSPVRNLLDDSECLPQNGSMAIDVKKVLNHTNSVTSQSSSNLFGLSPTINLYNSFGSLRDPDIERKSYVHFQDPDVLTNNQSPTLVMTGIVKRKIKSKTTISMSGYQRVLAKLFTNQLECNLSFYSAKTTKARTIGEFKEEYHANISLLNAQLKFDQLINSPKIYIELPHETFIVQSIEDHHHDWPSLHAWWNSMNDAINTVTASKAAVCQPQSANLINLEVEFTRL